MQQRRTAVRAIAVVDRARRLVEDLRVEIQTLHVQELDRAFLATNKGMTYARTFKLRTAGRRATEPLKNG